MIRHIIWDFGGVFASCSDELIYLDMAKEFKVSLDLIMQSASSLVLELQKGLLSQEGFWQGFSAKLGVALPRCYRELWSRKYLESSQLDKGMFKLARGLKRRGYTIALISNTISSHAELNRKRRAYGIFSPVILSCKVGMVKPDQKIFFYTLNQVGCRPEEAIYIDDDLDNTQV